MKSLTHFGFQSRILITVGVACAICATTAFFVSKHFQERELRGSLADKGRTVLSRLDAATDYVAQQGGLDAILESTTKKYSSPKDLTKEDKIKVLKQVPIFAAMKIGAKDADVENYTFRVFSDEPRRKENLASAQELEVFRKFQADPSLKEQVLDNGKVVTVFHPVRLSAKQGCLNCHGDPANSPWKNGEDVLGFKMENWTDGKLHGVFAITSDVALVKAATQSAQTISSTTYLILFITIGGIIALLVAAWFVRGPIRALTQVAIRLNQSGDELGNASQQLSSASQQVSSGAAEAAASLEETVASIEELSSMVQLNADHSKEASSLSQSSTSSATRGETEISTLIDSMTDISSSSKKIEEIITVIDDIAFQTNLLALNAAVEAARAGEQGKGFAVVAEAVRSLAQRSASAAKDISSLIKESVVQIERGAKVADSSGVVLREIVTSVKKVSDLNSEIAQASGEQAKGISGISKAMTELDSSTQSNAAASEEVAATSEQMSRQSELIRDLVQELNAVLKGSEKGAVQPPAQQPPMQQPLQSAPKPASSPNVIPFKKTGTEGF